MRRVFTVGLLTFVLSVVALAQEKEKDPAEAIRDLDSRRIQALVKGNVQAIQRMYATNFVITSSSGKVRTRKELIAALRSGDLKYESIRTRDVNVQFFGPNRNVAIETGRAAVVGTDSGTTLPAESRFTRVWVRAEGRWQLVAQHASPIAQ